MCVCVREDDEMVGRDEVRGKGGKKEGKTKKCLSRDRRGWVETHTGKKRRGVGERRKLNTPCHLIKNIGGGDGVELHSEPKHKVS